PYGDVWLKLKPLAYTSHPYQWNTIGKEIAHIEDADMADVRAFFRKHYAPQNAVLVVAGAVAFEEVKRLAEKWFGPIEGGPRYHAVDLLADLLGRGKSSRLHQKLVKELELFNNISASLTGALDPGLLVVSGKLNAGVALEAADRAVETAVAELLQAEVPAAELEKVKNQAETGLVFGEIELLNRALALAIGKLLGNANLVNEEPAVLQAVTPADIRQAAELVLRPENCTTLYYRAAESETAPEVVEEVATAA
ncbi:MAG: insulinase family protein, partial [Cytophagaceae bacterium]